MEHFVSQWVIPPDVVNELATMYGLAEKLLIDQTATSSTYRQAVVAYARYLEHAHVVIPGWGDRFGLAVPHFDLEENRALLHRLNCQVLQILAHKEVCELPCCCRCPGAYENIPCLRPLIAMIVLQNEVSTAN